MGQWLTPDNIPASNSRRVLLVPDDKDWRAALTGALLMLSDVKSWEKFGDLTPEQTAQVWADVLDEFLIGEICP